MTDRPTPSISRAQVVAAAADPRAPTVEAIEARIEACDFRAAAVSALARRQLGHDVPLAVVAEILPGLRDVPLALGLIAVASGDRAATLLDAVERHRFPRDGEAVDVEVIALYAAWRAGADVVRVIPQARRLSRTQLGTVALAVFAELVVAIADPNLSAACGALDEFRTPAMRAHVAAADRALAASLDQVLAQLPDEAVAPAGAGFTLRAGPRVGRNDPCPCGSGLKYKKCCADKQLAVAASPIPGLSWDDYVRTAADRMSPDDVDRLPLRDLARVDLAALADRPLVAAFRRFLREKRWQHAIRAIDQAAARHPDAGDEWREELILDALAAGDLELARGQLAQVRDPEIAAVHREELELHARDADSYARLIDAAAAALRRDLGAQVDLAYALLRAAPPLGILVARGCLSADRAADSELLLDVIEDVRDALNLPPGDPGWDVFAALAADADAEHEADAAHAGEARALRSSLHATASRVEQLERELAAKQAELSAARTPAPAAASATPPPADPERVRALRAKIEELEGRVREGNTERGELRRQLASVRTSAKAAEPEPPARAAEPDEGDAVAAEGRGVVVPGFDRRVIDALDNVPRPVAAEAMRTVGSLAAGDTAAWRGVKQARDMPRPLLMARVGIHHRLLFRCERDSLDVLELITREELLATLKRLRARG